MSRGSKHKEGKLSTTYQQQAIGNKGTSCMQTMFSACSFQQHVLVSRHPKEVEVFSNFEYNYSNVCSYDIQQQREKKYTRFEKLTTE